MSVVTDDRGRSLEEIRGGVAERLRARHLEIEEAILRRYIAGQALLADHILEEADRSDFPGDEAAPHQHLRRTQTPIVAAHMAGVLAVRR